MWVPKLLLPPVKSRIFCSKTAKFGPKYAFYAHIGPANSFGALLIVGSRHAGCILQDTYLIYIITLIQIKKGKLKGVVKKADILRSCSP